jgi:cytochrome c551/c552
MRGVAARVAKAAPRSKGRPVSARRRITCGVFLVIAAGVGGCGFERGGFGFNVGPAEPPPQVLALLRTHGCVHCHTMDSVPGATGRVGPSLVGFEQRRVFAGGQPNQEAALVRFLLDPRSLSPGSAMPRTVTEEAQAAQIAAWLLRQDH